MDKERIRGYLIEWTPWIYMKPKNVNGYTQFFYDSNYEYFDNEKKFLHRAEELESITGEYEPGKFCDGILVETYMCDPIILMK